MPEHPDDDGACCAGRLQRIALLHEMGQYERVVEEAGRLCADFPDLSQAHLELALGLFDVGRIDEARREAREARARVNEALSLEPDHAGALALQAELASSTRERSSHAALRRSMLLVARGCAIPRSRGVGRAARGGEGARGRQSPGAAGAAGRADAHPTSTYLPNMNVPFSHPSELNPQKDGRKVRSRDELPLTLRPAAPTSLETPRRSPGTHKLVPRPTAVAESLVTPRSSWSGPSGRLV